MRAEKFALLNVVCWIEVVACIKKNETSPVS